MPANQTQMDNIETAMSKLQQVVSDLRALQRVLKKFKNEVDPSDEFNVADYADVKSLFTPLWVGVRDALESDWSDFKTYVNSNL